MRNFILLVALFFVTQWLLKKLRRANERAQTAARSGGGRASSSTSSSSSSGRAEASAPPQLADPLIRCAQCGVHTPRSESILLAGERFCCTDHANRYVARPTGRDAR